MFKKVRNWKVALALTMIIAVANLPLQYQAYRFFYVKPLLESLPEGIRPIADYESFFQTGYWRTTVGVWLALIVLWAIYLAKRKVTVNYKKPSTACIVGLLCFVLCFALFHIQLARCECNVYRRVDVLMIGDEEFRAIPSWMTNAENVLYDVSRNRFDESRINFYMRGWLAWDSLDGQTDICQLMQEALVESGLPIQQVEIVPGLSGWGFISGSEWTDAEGGKWWIDLLLIFTGQDANMLGLSPSKCNATIIRYDSVNLYILTHELGHQYYLQHCDDPWCVMNIDWRYGDNFCSSCRATLTSHNRKWLTDPEIYIGCDDEEGKIVKPGEAWFDYVGRIWYIAGVKCGTTLTIRAEAKEGWCFSHYYGMNAPIVFSFSPNDPPPPSFYEYAQEFDFTFNDTWTIIACFVPARYLTISSIGRGTTNPSGVVSYPENGTATVHAIPDTGYAFKYWKLDGVTYYSNPINVYMGSTHSLQAYFTQDYLLRIWVDRGNGATNPTPGEYWYYEGTKVTITATPQKGYCFSYWNIDGHLYYKRTQILTMNKNHDACATFSLVPPAAGGSHVLLCVC